MASPPLPVPPALPGSQPTTREERIGSLDILRGIALFGILLINITAFALSIAAAENPFYAGELAPADFTAWWFNHYFVEWRAISTFSILFGAGMILSTQKKDALGFPVAGHFYRRYGILAAIGFLHAYFVWFGDILLPYAICSAIVFLMRRFSPRVLLAVGLASVFLSLSVFSLLYCFDGAEFTEHRWLSDEELTAEIATVRGPWPGWFLRNAFLAAAMQFGALPLGLGGFCAGLMLIGMSLQKTGFFTGDWKSQSYLVGMVIGILLGVLMTLPTTQVRQLSHAELPYLHVLKGKLAPPIMSFGYLCLVLLLLQSSIPKKALAVFAPAGRMALTLYLMQSVVCGFIFSGYGLGLFETMGRASLWIFSLLFFALQVAFAHWWFKSHRFGPLEWAWRRLSYGRLR